MKENSRGSGSNQNVDGERISSKLQKPFSSTFVAKMSLQTSGKEPLVNVENVDHLRKSASDYEDLGSRSFSIAPINKNGLHEVDTELA
jgi:hypothetical protein